MYFNLKKHITITLIRRSPAVQHLSVIVTAMILISIQSFQIFLFPLSMLIRITALNRPSLN